ncbi:MAG: hypothetical protein SFV20_01430 [Sphingopyxis sp.]|nr:hypothetical protein [Sphingopyxis sp.]
MAGQGFDRGRIALAEIKEFAGFPAGTQRYIRRSLDIAFAPAEPRREEAVERWSRDGIEQVKIRVQARYYERIGELRERVPESSDLGVMEGFMAPLVSLSAFDLAQEKLPHFSSYRFLYERLIGAAARPWLPGAFCAAAALPHIEPARRRELLQTISESAATAPGWSRREPSFYPGWVDKDDPADGEVDVPEGEG